MTKTKKKICLQVVGAPDPFGSLVGMYLIENGDGFCGLTRDTDCAQSFDSLDDAVSIMYGTVASPFTFSPVIILEGGDE